MGQKGTGWTFVGTLCRTPLPGGTAHGDTGGVGGQREENTRKQPHPSLLQLLLGRTDAALRLRKLWRFLPALCRQPLLHKPCANLFFLLGGYNEKNLNMVGASRHMEGMELGSTPQCPQALPAPLSLRCLRTIDFL